MLDSWRPYWPVVMWLGLVSGLVFAMIVIGGITRLTESGLSMVEWRPLIGTIPPLDAAEWNRVFSLYQSSPEYRHLNAGMELAEFKWIFFWEYMHRLMGRLVGLAYALPLVWFFFRGQLPQGYHLRFLILFLLGALQAVVGWWMVKSGLVDLPFVSPYRLAIHLGLALVILSIFVWTICDLVHGRAPLPRGINAAFAALLATTIVAGAFVAGMNAGLVYNEYPLMGGQFIPPEYGFHGLTDPFENPASAQFHHRWLAFAVLLAATGLWASALKSTLRLRAHLMLVAVAGQFLLGIFVLLYRVPVTLGTMHQAGAALLLIAALWLIHGLEQRK